MTSKSKNFTMRRGYTKLLAILLCIAIIPGLLISALAYSVSIHNAKKEAVMYSTQYLNQIVKSNTVILQQSESVLFELMLNFSSYSDILRQPRANAASLQLLQTLEKKKLASEPYIRSFYFVDKRSGKIYASDRSSIYALAAFPDQNLIKQLGDVNLLVGDLFERVTSSGQHVATYVARYPLTGQELGYLVIDLDLDRIGATGQGGASSGGELLIMNRHGQLINNDRSETLRRAESRPGDYVVIRQSSDETGLSYQYVIPKRELVANSRILLNSIIGISLVFVLLEVAAAWFSSNKLYSPLRNLLQYIQQLVGDRNGPPADGSEDEYYYVRNVITNMNVQNNDYLDTFKANGALFKQRQLARLLKGELSEARAMRLPETLKLKLPHPSFIVFMMEVEYDSDNWVKSTVLEQELLLYAVTNVTEEVLAEFGHAVTSPLDTSRVVVLLNHSRADQQLPVYEHMARQVQTKIAEFLKLTISIGIGQPCPGDADIPRSYEQAHRALSAKVYYGKGSIISEGKLLEQPHAERNVSWSELKAELKTLLQAGEWEPIAALLRGWVDRLSFPGMTETDVQFYLLQYTACLSDLSADFSVDFEELTGKHTALFETVRQTVSVTDLTAETLRLATLLLDRIKATKEHIHQELIQNLLVYIREHLDQDLTLESLAEKVYMHPAYLSRICKSLTGKGLGEQIVLARIERAKELLIGSSQSVNDISQQLGYTNPRAFYRLFKEYTTMTPGEFRKKAGLRNVQ